MSWALSASTCVGPPRHDLGMDEPVIHDVDQLIEEILAEAEWTDPVPEYEDLMRDWPDCPEM